MSKDHKKPLKETPIFNFTELSTNDQTNSKLPKLSHKLSNSIHSIHEKLTSNHTYHSNRSSNVCLKNFIRSNDDLGNLSHDLSPKSPKVLDLIEKVKKM